MGSSAVPMVCAECGMTWEVLPKPDGTMPQAGRCPRYRGGCGKLRKVPRDPPSVAPAAASARQCCEHCAPNRAAVSALAVALVLAVAVIASGGS